jgi:WD40 repeat protein
MMLVGVRFSPDGARVLTWSEDGTARLWELVFDAGTAAQWDAIEERTGYALRHGELVTR